uniref:Uncharacterized protein n=1 Tax=uncultured microorganism TaxID=358574 RepID=I2FJH9_9ZZZZ|nr:hypothetical protein [uncultured microorganism]
MSLSDREIEALCLKAWKRRAKGRGMRWRILRDVVAVLSQAWMTTFQVQIALRRIWGVKNNTTRDMLEELETEKSVFQERYGKEKTLKWGATESGVAFWIGKVENIPVSIAQVAEMSASVKE